MNKKPSDAKAGTLPDYDYMKVRFTLEALEHIRNIYSYLNSRSSIAASRTIGLVRGRIDRLQSLPRLGHPGVVEGTLEIKVTGLPYIIVYVILGDEIAVLGVYHASRTRDNNSPL